MNSPLEYILVASLTVPTHTNAAGTTNTLLEYILVGIVALAILVYLLIALLKPELF
jgi:F subunit of K+-transporting ATPase (Potass_KdpF)